MTKDAPLNFLDKIELQGFKSFASKTVLEFPKRITCIVGPNGSGKSNIIDAVRWVLGERESKHLRGEGLENLIFAGTPKRNASSLARVDLYFINKNNLFPLDNEEVVLSRRVDRGGESEIYINDTEIKLKDLLPLLARIKLGSRGIVIIGQGQSDIFVASSPKERREMIEEVLGLKEFRIKKNQSERRLENSLINIEKIKASLEELEPQVRVFKKQKTRLEKKEEIEKELFILENNYFSFKYNNLKNALSSIKSPLQSLLEEKEKLSQKIKKEEKFLNDFYKDENLHKKSKEAKERIDSLWQERIAKEKELYKLEIKINSAEKSTSMRLPEEGFEGFLKYLEIEIKKAIVATDLQSIKTILKNVYERISALSLDKREKKDENLLEKKVVLEKEIIDIDNKIGALRKEEQLFFEKEREYNLEFKKKVEELNKTKNELYILDAKINEINLKEENVKEKIFDIEREWVSLGRNLEDLKNFKIDPNLNEFELPKMEKRINYLRGEIASIGEIDQNVLNEFQGSEERYNFLSVQLADLEKAAADLRKLIKELDQRIKVDFKNYFKEINIAFDKYFHLMFGGGKAKLVLREERKSFFESESGEVEINNDNLKEEEKENDEDFGIDLEVNLPRKKIKSVNMLSGGEKTLLSLAALFALISISSPPFLVLDEIDAALDEENARKFAELIKNFSSQTQFIIVTHNRSTMEVADILYGVTMGEDGVSQVLSLKFDDLT